MATDQKHPQPAWRRVAWFVALYGASVLAVAGFAYGLKAIFGGLFF